MGDDACLLIFTKPAVPGRVKTRLTRDPSPTIGPSAALSPTQAAEIHAAFLSDVLASMAGGPFAVRLAWALEEGEEIPLAEPPGEVQEGADLGERLYAALARAARSFSWVAAVGSDHPELERETVEEAFGLLRGGVDVVLGPSDDGGYYLVAARAASLDPALFRKIPWSTERVLATTLRRAASAGLRDALLSPGFDVDTPADLEALVARLEAHPGGCPRTRQLLQRWGRLGAAPVAAGRAVEAHR